jgi:hypothetical protein
VTPGAHSRLLRAPQLAGVVRPAAAEGLRPMSPPPTIRAIHRSFRRSGALAVAPLCACSARIRASRARPRPLLLGTTNSAAVNGSLVPDRRIRSNASAGDGDADQPVDALPPHGCARSACAARLL